MTKVLIVDDSAVDRRLVSGVLGKDSDIEVELATNGAEALEMIAARPPDLVVTDMLMPGMNGLELVSEIRERHPLVPVILVTSRGNEEIAVQALQRGAASYVPKRTVAQELVDTVHSVLAVSRQRRGLARLLECMTHSHSTFVLENDSTLFSPLVSHLQENAALIGVCDESERVRIGVALGEALANAMYHGNLEVSSELREIDDTAYCNLIEQRRRNPPYCQRKIHVDARVSRTEAIWTVRDEGPGFDPASLADPTDPANFDKASGRGLLLIRTFMDEVFHNDQGNAVTLIKRNASAAVASVA